MRYTEKILGNYEVSILNSEFEKYEEMLEEVLQLVKKDSFLDEKNPLEKRAKVLRLIPDKDDEVEIENSQGVTQKSLYIKYNDQLYLKIMETANESTGENMVHIDTFSLKKFNGSVVKKLLSFENGQLTFEHEIPVAVEKLELPIENSQEDNTLKAQLDLGVPCFNTSGGTCCQFRYNANPLNPLVTYRWCGQNCGSGIPVNPLDECCKQHDICYGNNPSGYPARCSCDLDLINCARRTDEAGTDRVISAFMLKRSYMRCYTS